MLSVSEGSTSVGGDMYPQLTDGSDTDGEAGGSPAGVPGSDTDGSREMSAIKRLVVLVRSLAAGDAAGSQPIQRLYLDLFSIEIDSYLDIFMFKFIYI